MSMLMTTAKQVELLGHNFENCIYTTLLQLHVAQDDVIQFSRSFNQYGSNSNVNDDYYITNTDSVMRVVLTESFQVKLKQNLGICVRHHQKMLKFVRRLEDFIWPLMSIKMMASMFYHILICFMLVCNGDKVFVYTLAQYEIMAVFELILVSYFGQYLINKEEELKNQVYNCPWYICDVSFQKSIVLVLNGCLCIPSLSVVKLAPLSLPTVLAMLKSSTSIFTVLRQTLDY
ncbi:odorant receptor 67c-like isoform X2 [Photinus pyralis]|nr:odorant receptor 67c-like isoform X2 [Photinus pyralis]